MLSNDNDIVTDDDDEDYNEMDDSNSYDDNSSISDDFDEDDSGGSEGDNISKTMKKRMATIPTGLISVITDAMDVIET